VKNVVVRAWLGNGVTTQHRGAILGNRSENAGKHCLEGILGVRPFDVLLTTHAYTEWHVLLVSKSHYAQKYKKHKTTNGPKPDPIQSQFISEYKGGLCRTNTPPTRSPVIRPLMTRATIQLSCYETMFRHNKKLGQQSEHTVRAANGLHRHSRHRNNDTVKAFEQKQATRSPPIRRFGPTRVSHKDARLFKKRN